MEYNTPNVDAPVAYLLRHWNLRDSDVEDNVRNVLLPQKPTLKPVTGYLSLCKYTVLFR